LDFTLRECEAYDKPVLAVASGTVKEISTGHSHGEVNSYGNKVVVDHGNGYTSLYAHLNQVLVQKNQKVAQGKKIGTVGNTGYCLGHKCDSYPGTHLHFRMLKDGNPYKPEPMSTYTNFATGQWRLSDNYESTSTQTSWHFNTPGNTEGWEAHNVEEYSVNSGDYFINPKQADPWIQINGLLVNANQYNAIEINMASNCQDGNGRIYFTTSNSPGYNDKKMVEFKVNNDGNWRPYTIYMAQHKLWQGTITGLRIDPAIRGWSGTPLDTVGFNWIRIIDTSEKPSITYSELNFGIFSPWSTITFKYSIHNPFANKFEDVRLGAQIRTNNPQGTWIDDRANDKVITLNSGTNGYSRIFWIPYSISTGNYDAHWVILKHSTGIWFDNKEELNAILIMSGTSTLPVIAPDPTPTPTPTPTPAPTPPGCP
jgi:hypothetical protein